MARPHPTNKSKVKYTRSKKDRDKKARAKKVSRSDSSLKREVRRLAQELKNTRDEISQLRGLFHRQHKRTADSANQSTGHKNRKKAPPCSGCSDFSCVRLWRNRADLPFEDVVGLCSWLEAHDFGVADSCPTHGSCQNPDPNLPDRLRCCSRLSKFARCRRKLSRFGPIHPVGQKSSMWDRFQFWLHVAAKDCSSSMNVWLSKNKNTVSANFWEQLQRLAIIAESQCTPSFKMMSVDETFFGKRKYHRGRRVRKSGWWFVTATEILPSGHAGGTRWRLVKRRDRTTLTNFVASCAGAGKNTVVFTDEWRAYSQLKNIVKHYTVKHAVSFVSKHGIHTNHSEGVHGVVKENIRKLFHRYGTNSRKLRKHVAAACLFFNCGGWGDRVATILNLAKDHGPALAEFEDLDTVSSDAPLTDDDPDDTVAPRAKGMIQRFLDDDTVKILKLPGLTKAQRHQYHYWCGKLDPTLSHNTTSDGELLIQKTTDTKADPKPSSAKTTDTQAKTKPKQSSAKTTDTQAKTKPKTSSGKTTGTKAVQKPSSAKSTSTKPKTSSAKTVVPTPKVNRPRAVPPTRSPAPPHVSSAPNHNIGAQGTVGIRNIGNSCFFSAAAQLLFSISEVDLLLSEVTGWTLHMRGLLSQVRSVDPRARAAKPTIHCITNIAQFTGWSGTQEDASDWLSNALDHLDTGGGRRKVYTTDTSIFRQQVGVIETSWWSVDPEGKTGKVYKMESEKSKVVERSWNAMIAVAVCGKTLSDCLSAYLEPVRIVSSKGKPISQGIDIVGVSSHVLLSLKRFTNRRKKNTRHISFPEVMSLSGMIFAVASVVVHIGSTLASGHYVCFAKRNDQWHKFDDGDVSVCGWDEVAKCQAYMLLYHRTGPQSPGAPAPAPAPSPGAPPPKKPAPPPKTAASPPGHPPTSRRTFYNVLQCDTDATPAAVRASYRRLALQYHPDKNKAADKSRCESLFKELGEAYEVLEDEDRRKKYDYFLKSRKRKKPISDWLDVPSWWLDEDEVDS